MAELTDRKTRKYIKRGRGRPWKNFLWWLFGLISAFLISAGVAALCICVFPIRTYTGQNTNKYVNEEIGNGSILNFILNFQSYEVGDLPIIREVLTNVVQSSPLKDYIEIDYDALDGLGYKDFTDGNFQIMDYITITATINSIIKNNGVNVGGLEQLATFGEWEQVPGDIDPNSDGFVPALYYYVVQQSGEKSAMTYAYDPNQVISGSDGNSYKRAFTDDKERVPASIGKPLYYPALFDLPLMESFANIQQRFMVSSATSLLKFAGIEPGNMIYEIIDGYTIGGLKNMNTNDIKLSVVMPVEKNQDLYNLLTSALDGITASEITLGDLSGLSINSIKLTSVLKYEQEVDEAGNPKYDKDGEPIMTNGELYNILSSATGVEAEEITIGDLSDGITVDDIKLSTFVDVDDNKDLYDILSAATDVDNPKDITISNLKNMNIDKVKISTLIPKENNDDLYRVLHDVTGIPDDQEITVADLKKEEGLDMNAIKLTSVLPYEQEKDGEGNPVYEEDGVTPKMTNAELYDILGDMTGHTDDYAKITIGDLNDLDFDEINLLHIMSETEYSDLYEILRPMTDTNPGEKLQLKMLKGELDYGKIKLSSVLAYEQKKDADGNPMYEEDGVTPIMTNADIYDILTAATGKATPQDIIVSDLGDESFDIGQVKLTSVIEEEGNETLYDILKDATGNATAATITISSLRNDTSSTEKNFDINKVRMITVIPNDKDPITNEGPNDQLYDIICDSVNSKREKDWDPIEEGRDFDINLDGVSENTVTIGDLDGLDLSGAKISTLMTSPSDDLKSILTDGCSTKTDEIDPVTGEYIYETKDFDELTVSDLDHFTVDNVLLSSVVDDQKSLDIIASAAGKNSDYVRLGDMSADDFNLNNAKMKDILDLDDGSDQDTFKKILVSACGYESYTDGDGYHEGHDTYDKLVLGDVNNFKVNKIKMVDVIPEEGNETLYKILLDSINGKGAAAAAAAGQDYTNLTSTDLTVGDLNDGLDFDYVKLNNLLDFTTPSGSNLLRILLGATPATDESELTVGSLGDFDADGIYLNDIVDFSTESGQTLLNILIGATSATSEDDLKVGSLASFDPDGIVLKDIIDFSSESGQKLLKILLGATPATSQDNLTVGSLASFDANGIYLKDIIDFSTESGEKLLKILLGATPATSQDDLKVGSLASFDANGIYMKDIIDFSTESGEKLLKILIASTLATSEDDLVVGHLASFEASDIYLKDIVDFSETTGNPTLLKILIAATSATSEDDLTVGSLTSFNPEGIYLKDVVAPGSNDGLYDILEDLTGKDSDEVTVGDLDGFDAGQIHLSKVIDPASNAKLYDILADATGKDSTTIKVADLSSFEVSNIRLSTAMDTSDNAILNALIADDTVTIGNLGTKINGINLYSAYGDTAFTKNVADTAVATDIYRKGTDGAGKVTYTFDTTGLATVTDENDYYYVSKSATIWLLFCYDASNFAANGRANLYTQSEMTFNDLVSGSADDRITDATIYTLIAGGMITDDGYSDYVKSLTINGIITALKDLGF